MSESNRPAKGTPEYEKQRQEIAKKRAEELLSGECDFVQTGVLNGSKESMRDKNLDGNPNLKTVKPKEKD